MRNVEGLKKALTRDFSGKRYKNPKDINTFFFANDCDFNQNVLPELSKFQISSHVKNEQEISIAFVVGPSYLPSILPEMTKFDLLIVADYNLNCLKWIKTMITSCAQHARLEAHQEKIKHVYTSHAPNLSYICVPYEKAESTDAERMGTNHFTKRYELVHDAAKLMCERTHYLPIDLSNTDSVDKLKKILKHYSASIYFLNSTNLTDFESRESIVCNFQTLPFAPQPLIVYSVSETGPLKYPQPYSKVCSNFSEYEQLKHRENYCVTSIFTVPIARISMCTLRTRGWIPS